MNRPVLLIAGDYSPVLGGIADYTRRLATALHEAGTMVSVLTTRHSEHTRETEESGVRVLRAMDGWRMRDIPRLLRLTRAAGHDAVVHLQYPAVAYGRNPMVNVLPAVVRQCIPRHPVVVTVHDARVMRRRWRARIAPMVSTADAVVHVDPPDGEYLAPWTWGARPINECIPIASPIIPLPATDADRLRWRDELGLAGSTPIVVFFGMLYAHKGLEELVEAVVAVRAAGIPARLLVIGDFDRPTPYEANVRRLVGTGMDDGWVVWLRGAAEQDVSRGLWAADVAALPFHSGAASNRSSLLAALAHGLETVTTRGHATPPDFDRHFPAALVPVRDPRALAEAIASAIRRAAGATRATTHLPCVPDWPEVARRHLDLYARLAPRRAAA